MPQPADTFDLSSLQMTAGDGRRLDLAVALGSFELGGELYETDPAVIGVRLEVSRTTGDGFALVLRFEVSLTGPCMRCLGEAAPSFQIEAREVSQPGVGEELESPYVSGAGPVLLALRAWARDALALALPAQVLCRPDCLGLCAVCGADLNRVAPDHHHDAAPDPRWAKLSELRLDE